MALPLAADTARRGFCDRRAGARYAAAIGGPAEGAHAA